MGLLDVVLGYDCNLGCDYCTLTPAMRKQALTTAAVRGALVRAREDGLSAVSFTGGEPTIRPDLLPLVREARRLGFEDVKVQTNGLLLAERSNVERLAAAGVTRVHISVHSHRPQAYERIVRRAGTFPLMEQALRNVAACGDLVAHADLIVMRQTLATLPRAIPWIAERGVGRAFLWYVSLTDGNRDNFASLPPIRDALPQMFAAFDQAADLGVDLKSLHVPRCLLGDYADRAHDPGAGRVRVLTPEASFELQDAPLTPGQHVEACRGCAHEAYCPGIRRDYLEVFGDEEIAAARGKPPALGPTRLPVL